MLCQCMKLSFVTALVTYTFPLKAPAQKLFRLTSLPFPAHFSLSRTNDLKHDKTAYSHCKFETTSIRATVCFDAQAVFLIACLAANWSLLSELCAAFLWGEHDGGLHGMPCTAVS